MLNTQTTSIWARAGRLGDRGVFRVWLTPKVHDFHDFTDFFDDLLPQSRRLTVELHIHQFSINQVHYLSRRSLGPAGVERRLKGVDEKLATLGATMDDLIAWLRANRADLHARMGPGVLDDHMRRMRERLEAAGVR